MSLMFNCAVYPSLSTWPPPHVAVFIVRGPITNNIPPTGRVLGRVVVDGGTGFDRSVGARRVASRRVCLELHLQ